MKQLIALFLILFVGMCGCLAIFGVINVGLESVVPSWAKKNYHAWLMGTPQSTDMVEVSDYVSAGEEALYMGIGTKAFTGYSGPEGFLCAPMVQSEGILLSDHFGTFRGEGFLDHTGIDYAMDYRYKEQGHTMHGVDVTTPMSGKVTWVGIYNGWGNAIIIENNGYQVLFGHATEFKVSVDDIVDAGDVVMTAGGDNQDERDGNSSGAHLHFEVRKCSPGTEGTEATCGVVDPNATVLPGQSDACAWDGIQSLYATPSNTP